MKIACPSCGAEMPLDVAVAHDEHRRLMAHIIERSLLLGSYVTRYLRLFKPPKQALRADRLRKLLDELSGDIQRQAIDHKGREWRVPVDAWKLGFEAVFDAHAKGTIDLPLIDNAYLYEVLMRKADKAEGEEEKRSEQERASKAAGRVHAAGADSIDRFVPAPASWHAPVAPAAPVEPSLYARKLQAEIAARKTAQQGSEAASDDAEAKP